MIIHPTSLSATLDAAAEAFFYHISLPESLRHEIASLIVSRQCQTGPNVGFFLPFASESDGKIKLFSGEQLTTNLAKNHLPMIQAVIILKQLGIEQHAITQSSMLAKRRMEKMCYSSFCPKGECKTLSMAYLHYLSMNGSANSAAQVKSHVTSLSSYRDGKGKWGGFPFFFSLWILSEIDDPLAQQELKYAAPFCEKQISQNWATDPFSKRRQEIILRALARS